VADRALQLLLSQLTADPLPAEPIMLAPRLIERMSVAAPPG
jgi:DNA-binding LacI/PurR family transcriptional regulator